ncbi:hypothetical protein KKG31_05890 [Patescibacteria group bacterium]|nr:hypothetical protein [Patescibacteria group bacterium]MBU1758635.1 hypothetical protein [Patescibacteria group bacterium]
MISIKIQLPLFGHYLKYTESLDEMMMKLQQHGIFMKADKLDTNNGIIYQISCNDYELLEVFAKWYERVEKFGKITKSDFTQEMKKNLLAFVLEDKQIPDEGKNEVIGSL